jgi:cysteine-rich repeat protein
VCGNGILELGEACDDGNEVDGDGCEATCVETPPAVCGNGTVEGDELCDDGNQTDGDGCQADCTLTPEAVCGNGVVETGEACDDGNTENGDDCTSSCTIPEPEEPEEPEDPSGGGLTVADDGCVCVGGRPVGTPASLLVLGALGALVLTRRRRR